MRVANSRKDKPDTVRGDGDDKASGVDEEHDEVERGEDDSPPGDEDEEAETIAVGVVRVVIVTATARASVRLRRDQWRDKGRERGRWVGHEQRTPCGRG